MKEADGGFIKTATFEIHSICRGAKKENYPKLGEEIKANCNCHCQHYPIFVMFLFFYVGSSRESKTYYKVDIVSNTK